MTPWARAENGGTVITVWLVPGAHRTEIVGVHGDALRIRVDAPAEGGRANRELVGLMEKRTGAPVELMRGGRSRRKALHVHGVAPVEVVAALDPKLPG